MRMCVHVCMCAHLCMYARACACTCMCACVRVCAYVCAPVHVSAFACMCTYLRVCASGAGMRDAKSTHSERLSPHHPQHTALVQSTKAQGPRDLPSLSPSGALAFVRGSPVRGGCRASPWQEHAPSRSTPQPWGQVAPPAGGSHLSDSGQGSPSSDHGRGSPSVSTRVDGAH